MKTTALRQMSASQLERNLDRCHAILATIEYFYPHHEPHGCRSQHARVMHRRLAYVMEIERRTNWEEYYANLYAAGTYTTEQYNRALAAIPEGA